jgi:hypothetical protein
LLGEADQRVAVVGEQRPCAAIVETVDCHDFIVVLSSSAGSIAEVNDHVTDTGVTGTPGLANSRQTAMVAPR